MCEATNVKNAPFSNVHPQIVRVLWKRCLEAVPSTVCGTLYLLIIINQYSLPARKELKSLCEAQLQTNSALESIINEKRRGGGGRAVELSKDLKVNLLFFCHEGCKKTSTRISFSDCRQHTQCTMLIYILNQREDLVF